jgi:hypothetical protein
MGGIEVGVFFVEEKNGVGGVTQGIQGAIWDDDKGAIGKTEQQIDVGNVDRGEPGLTAGNRYGSVGSDNGALDLLSLSRPFSHCLTLFAIRFVCHITSEAKFSLNPHKRKKSKTVVET